MFKPQIARLLIMLGFLLHLSYYGAGLVDFYVCEDKSSIVLEETESSEQQEKENSEKEDVKEKDKISQDFDQRLTRWVDNSINTYPDLFTSNISVYLEHKTPPPEFA